MAATLDEMARWMRATLGEFPAASNGVWRAGDGTEVRRLGVALEGSKAIAGRALDQDVDALLLHRPWGLGDTPPSLGVLAAHEALDDRLTLGDNPWLAARLGMTLHERIGLRRGWPMVVIARPASPLPLESFWRRLEGEFPAWSLGPHDALPARVGAIALANAMRPDLVTQAARAGAALYVTGTLRPSAVPTAREHALPIVLLGHTPPERWGLRWLAGALATRYDLIIEWLDDDAGHDQDDQR